MAQKKDLQQHIYVPIHSLKDLPKSPSKEERLKHIISNLDKHHNTVRHRLITAAKNSPIQNQLQEINPYPHTQEVDPASKKKANTLLIQNLAAPYIEGSGDPAIDPSAPLPAPPADIHQATPPPEIQRAKEVLDQIELYDRHAKPAREYYDKALKRMTQRRMSSSSSMTVTGGGRPVPERAVSGTSNHGSANASPVDPRLRR